jgi:hypothetical protein
VKLPAGTRCTVHPAFGPAFTAASAADASSDTLTVSRTAATARTNGPTPVFTVCPPTPPPPDPSPGDEPLPLRCARRPHLLVLQLRARRGLRPKLPPRRRDTSSANLRACAACASRSAS